MSDRDKPYQFVVDSVSIQPEVKVVEYSAYEKLQQQNQELRKELEKAVKIVLKQEHQLSVNRKRGNAQVISKNEARLIKQNQDLKENEQVLADKVNDLVDRMKIYEDHDDTIKDLKAFIKEACEIVKDLAYAGVDYGYGEHAPDIERARQFMSTDKYREYSSEK
jgi:nitrogen-specific signal transduction histidine kinase